MSNSTSDFLKHTGARVPIIGGAMYPCSNPELVAAVSEAGGIGIIQPLSLTFVHGYDLREGIRKIKGLTKNPVGFNILTEKSSQRYQTRMSEWLDIALEEGIRFYITALGNPSWVTERVNAQEGVVYHDVTEEKFALKVIDKGVKGLICVNKRAGGHAGGRSAMELYQELESLGLPLICAGGIGTPKDFKQALEMGYQGVQMGTRFIATRECNAHSDYKKAILNAKEKDIVLTEKVTGVPLAVIKTPHLEKVGTRANPVARWFLKNSKTKHWMRLYYTLISAFRLRKSNFRPLSTKDFWQAGKSVEGINGIKSVAEVIDSFSKQLK